MPERAKLGISHRRAIWEAGLLLAGVALAVVGVLSLPVHRQSAWPFWITVLGCLLTGVSLRSVEVPRSDLGPDVVPRRRMKIVGTVVFAGGLASAAFASAVLARNWKPYLWIVAWWTVSVFLAAVGLGLLQGFTPFAFRRGESKSAESWTKAEVGVFVLIIAVAAFLRFYRLEYFPPAFGIAAVEEVHSGNRAWRMLVGQGVLWEFPLTSVLTAVSFRLFGTSFTSLRLPTIALSILTIAMFYLLMRQLVGPGARIGATLLFAFSSWHLVYSRCNHAIFTPIPVSILFYYLLIRSRSSRRLSTFVWLGAVLAILMVSYAPFRMCLPFAVIFYLGVGISSLVPTIRAAETSASTDPPVKESGAGSRRQASLWGLLITVAVLIIMLYPTWKRIEHNPGYYFEAMHRSGAKKSEDENKSWAAVLESRYRRLKTVWLIYHFPQGAGTLAIRGRPQLDPVAGTILVLALGYLLLSPGKAYNAFFLLIFVVIFHVLGLFTQTFETRRLTALIPVLYILIGLWLGVVEVWFSNRFGIWGKRLFVALLPFALVIAAVWNWNAYFGEFIHDSRIRSSYVRPQGMMAGVLSSIAPGSRVIALAPGTHPLVSRKSDHNWLIPRDINTTGCKNTDELFDALVEMNPGERAILLMQKPVDLDAMETLLREALGCGPFTEIEHPDNATVTIRKVEFVAPDDVEALEAFRDRARQIEET